MSVLLAIFGLAFLVAGHVVAHAGARLAAARALGMRPLYAGLVVTEDDAWTAASRGARVAVRAAGPLGNYLWAALLMAIAAMAAGRYVVDETSLRVKVASGGPAAAAGVRDGDRVRAVGGARVNNWDEIRAAVRARPGEEIDLELERGGAVVHATPLVASDGKIRIGPPAERASVGVGEALVAGITGPARVLYMATRGVVIIMAGRDSAELAGPVGIVREASSQGAPSGGSEGARLLALGASYSFPFFVLLMVAPPMRTPRKPRAA